MYYYLPAEATTQILTGYIRKIMIQVNEDYTGSINVIDGLSETDANVAIITNPLAGQQFEYWDIKEGLRLSFGGGAKYIGGLNISVSACGSFGPK